MDSASLAALEQQIKSANGAARLKMQPKLEAAMMQLQQDGLRVPARLRNLNEALIQEQIEDRFDNLPV